jgi:hypothetical protein
VIIFFSKEVMLLWTRDAVIVQNTFLLVRVLAVGYALLGLMVVPYVLQLAFAWTKLVLYFNCVAIVVLVPLLIGLTLVYGAMGACFVWVVLNVGYVLGMIQWMHRRILPGEKWIWYRDDVGKPLLSASIVVVIGRLLISNGLPSLTLVVCLSGVLVVAAFSAAMSAPLIRAMILSRVFTWKIALGGEK